MKAQLLTFAFLIVQTQLYLSYCDVQENLLISKWEMINSTRNWIGISFMPIDQSIMVKMKQLVSEDCAKSVFNSLKSIKQLDDWAMQSKK